MKKIQSMLSLSFLFFAVAVIAVQASVSGGGGSSVVSEVNSSGYGYRPGESISSQVIALEPGWNVFSAPRLVESHEFSVDETLDNFAVYVLNNQSQSGWSTMQDLGQSEFTPLYGYFIFNKTEFEQYLILNYKQNTDPNERFFVKDLVPGWNVLGIANPSEALRQKESSNVKNYNIKNILTSLNGCVDTVVDFSTDQPYKYSVKIGEQWESKVYDETYQLNDFRETKAYAVYTSSDCTYQGWQNSGDVNIYPPVKITFNNSGYTENQAYIDFKVLNYYPINIERITGMIGGSNLNYGDIENIELYCDDEQKWILNNPALGDNIINEIWSLEEGTNSCQLRFNSSKSNFYGYKYFEAGLKDLTDSTYTTIKDSNGDLVSDILPAGDLGYSGLWLYNPLPSTFLTWTTTALTAKTVVTGATDVTIYQATLKAGASSDVTLTSVKLDVDDAYYEAFNDNNISKLDFYLDGKLIKSTVNGIVNDSIATAEIIFSSLDSTNRVIPADATVNLEVKADFASSFNPAGDFALEVIDVSSISARDIDNNTFNVTVSNAGTDSRIVSLVSSGALKVELKTDSQKADNDTYLLAGSETTQDRYLGELVFTAVNESVEINTLTLKQGGDSTDSDILVVRLYDADGVMVAQEGVSVDGHVDFNPLNYVFPADQATSLFIGVVAKSMNADGDAQGTATYGRDIQFSLADATTMTQLGKAGVPAVTAQGVDSGEDILILEDLNGAVEENEYSDSNVLTKITTISGSVLTSISNDMYDSDLDTGIEKTIGKYKFVFDNGVNRTINSKELMAEIVRMRFQISYYSDIQISNIKIHIEGDPANKSDAMIIFSAGGGSDGTVAKSGEIDLTSLPADIEFVDGEIILVVTADIAGEVTVGNYLRTAMYNLSYDFIYNGNNGEGVDISDPRLNITEVLGAILSR